MEKICKGLRNIGYHRNRGLGAVKCSLEDRKNGFELAKFIFSDDKEYEIKYTIYLKNDLMLPASNADKTLDYIPGTSVLGAFAAKYLKSGKEFDNNIFLSGNVKFGNLYISDKEGTEYFPAPGFMGKYKAPNPNEEYNELHGTQNFIAESKKKYKEKFGEDFVTPAKKPFKKGYISIEKDYKEPETKTVYHNNLADEDGGLYTQYCLCSGQYFSGRIIGKGEYIKKIYELMSDGIISFGRSKTAQYSRCAIISAVPSEVEMNTVKLSNEKKAAYLCESGAVICNDAGINDISDDALTKALGINGKIDKEFTRISSSVISGYNAKWNLKKPQFPVINGGSVIVFTPDEGKELDEIVYIGEKQNEGFGRVRLISDAENFRCTETEKSDNKSGKTGNKEMDALLDKFDRENKILECAIKNADSCHLGKSQVGRVALMCKESLNYDNFIKRIESIKTDSTRKAALSCFGDKAWEELKIDPDKYWKDAKKYILTLLTVKKYNERGSK